MVGPDFFYTRNDNRNGLHRRPWDGDIKKFIKWFVIGLGSLLAVVGIALIAVYAHMERRLDTVYDVPLMDLEIPGDQASIGEGGRLARIRGCNGGCHGEITEGSIFFDMPDGTRVVAPDLGRLAGEYTTADLERAIRRGVKPDGTSVVAIMPSRMFYHLADSDLAMIIAFLRAQTPGSEVLPQRRLGPIVRAMLFYFEKRFGWNIISAEKLDDRAPRLDAAGDDPLLRGKYLAMTSCPECHSDDLRGDPANNIPSLAIVAAYSLDDFRMLMATGVPIGGRELDLMAKMSLSRFSYFTEDELRDLHFYLQTLAASD